MCHMRRRRKLACPRWMPLLDHNTGMWRPLIIGLVLLFPNFGRADRLPTESGCARRGATPKRRKSWRRPYNEIRARSLRACRSGSSIARPASASSSARVWNRFYDDFESGAIDKKKSRELLYVAEAARYLGGWQDANDTFRDAVDADAKGKDGARANIEWAALFLEKYDAGHAEQSLQEALQDPAQGRRRARALRARQDGAERSAGRRARGGGGAGERSEERRRARRARRAAGGRRGVRRGGGDGEPGAGGESPRTSARARSSARWPFCATTSAATRRSAIGCSRPIRAPGTSSTASPRRASRSTATSRPTRSNRKR